MFFDLGDDWCICLSSTLSQAVDFIRLCRVKTMIRLLPFWFAYLAGVGAW